MLQQILQLLQQLVTWKNDVIANAKTTEELDALDPILRNALFRAFVSGQSKKISIQELIDEIASELALGNVPVVFKPVVIDFNTPGTTQSKIRAKLNSDPNYILKQGTLYIPYVQRIVLSNGTGFGLLPGSTGNYAIVTEYFMLTQGIEPDGDGIASIGIDGTEILSNGIRYFNTVDSRNFAPVDFYLGDIATDEIWDVVNLLGPGTDPVGPLSTPNGTTVLFFATQDGEERIWLYRGAQEQVGLGEPATTEDDFRLFPSEDETDPPPAYQETVPQIGFSGSSILYVDNHEGRLISMDAPFYQTSFTTRRLRLGGFTRALINTTGQTEYPKVKNKWLLKMGTGSGTANIVISGTNYLISQNATPYVMENNFVATHAANILSSKGLTVIFNSDGYLEFDGLTVPSITIVTASGTLTGTVRTIAAVQINTPEFTVGLFDMFTEFDGKQINYTFKPRVIEGYNGFVLKQYDDIDDLLSNQSEQKPNALYLVIDASDDTNISFGVGETNLQATYRFKGTSETGSILDYTLISAPYGNHSVNTKPLVTPDTGTEITLYPFGNFCNSYVPNLETTAFTFVLTNSGAPAGETATVLIKTDSGASDFPELTDAEYVEGAPFAVDSYYDLHAWHNGATVAYTFLSRSAPPLWTIIPEVIGTVGSTDTDPIAGTATVPSHYTFGTGTIEKVGNNFDTQYAFFGEFSIADYPSITSYRLSFVLDVLPATYAIYVMGDNGNGSITGSHFDGHFYISAGELKVFYPDATSTLADTITGIVQGDKIDLLIETGELKVYVNDVLESTITDVGITFTKILSSFRIGHSTVRLSNIKQTMYVD